jgi:Double sensory domain of two-component sensor kinase
MLPLQFFGQNLHFALSLFAALVFFAVFWLYFDAWTGRRQTKELASWVGFLLLAISFVVSATVIEQSVLGKALLGSSSEALSLVLRVAGYIAIIVAQIIDPLQPKPTLTGLDAKLYTGESADTDKESKSKPKNAALIGFTGASNTLHFFTPLGAGIIAGLYWRRATTGLERHLKPVGLGFAALAVYELLSLGSLLKTSDNPRIAQFTASFGPLWILEHIALLVTILIIGKWVWQYLTKRFMSQLFMIFTSLTLLVFLLTTVSFTFLLVNNVQKASLDNLKTAASVLGYALDGKKAETLANSEAVAANQQIAQAVATKDHAKLVSLTDRFLHDKKQSSLIITNDAGQVLVRAEDPDQWGDSLSSDTLLRRSLIGQSGSTVSTKEDVLAPLVYIRSATPIRDANQTIIGSVMVGIIADNSFVDGIKSATGLNSAIYAGNVRSATTFVAPNGTSRWVGIKENKTEVTETVLKQGKTYTGTSSVQNKHYLTVYAPLKDLDNAVIGMLFIGQPQSTILQTAGRSVQLTFVVTAMLLVLSIIPAYLISRYLARQLD